MPITIINGGINPLNIVILYPNNAIVPNDQITPTATTINDDFQIRPNDYVVDSPFTARTSHWISHTAIFNNNPAIIDNVALPIAEKILQETSNYASKRKHKKQ